MTPPYLELINTFKKLLGAQRTDCHGAQLRYDNGLEKILPRIRKSTACN